MKVQVTVEMPQAAFSALRATPGDFVKEMRLAAAVKWYEIGRVSQAKAAALAGVSRQRFVDALGRFGVSPFQCTAEELACEASGR